MSKSEHDVLARYVHEGKLMQIGTVDADGEPSVCSVWYSSTFQPDRLYFTSRFYREHSGNIRRNGRVAGTIVAVELEGLGQPVRGVSFKGSGHEIALSRVRSPLEDFLGRWPRASAAISLERLEANSTPSRLYQIDVTEWTLFDEVNYPTEPRRVIKPA